MKLLKYFHKLEKSAKLSFLAVGVVAVGAASWSLVKTYGANDGGALQTIPAVISEPEKPRHVKTPESVKAIYMTSWVAGTKDWRGKLVDMIKKTELNSVVIDVKDYSGRVSFDTGDPTIKEIGSEEIRVKDMKDFVETLRNPPVIKQAATCSFIPKQEAE